jgi:hypothetical protein
MRFICFSSGAQRRYRDDIVRVMAMPGDCEITFRYRLKYLAHSVQEHVKAGRISQADQVLICYLDQSDKTKPVDFIPIRFATPLEAPVIGDFVVLRMKVGKFAYSADITAFNREIQGRSGEVPKWPDGSDAQFANGAFWVEVGDYPKSVVESVSNSDWQNVVGQLLKRTDFASTGPFYKVVGVQNLNSRAAVEMSGGQYELQGAREYELIIDHFLPGEATSMYQLETALSGDALTFITGSTMQIDSPYDRHWLRFRTKEPIKSERAVLTVNKKASGEDSAVQFDLPISVQGRLAKAIWIGIAVGLLLAIPQITTVWINPAFSTKPLEWLIGLASFILVFNIAVGIAAALNFRKPI